MEKRHQEEVAARFPDELTGKRLVCPHIPDDDAYGGEELLDAIEAGVGPLLGRGDGGGAALEWAPRAAPAAASDHGVASVGADRALSLGRASRAVGEGVPALSFGGSAPLVPTVHPYGDRPRPGDGS